MTIFTGSHGSITFYYKGLLINSFPLTKERTITNYLQQGDELIKASKGINIKKQIKVYILFCNEIWKRKKNKQPIYRGDHIHFLNCITALLRLRIIDNDEMNGYLIMPKLNNKKGHNLRLKII